MDKIYIEKKVHQLLRGDTQNLYNLADNHNILVYECDLGNNSGLYLYIEKTKTILLNHKLSYFKKQIVLAHEIAHAILHPKMRCAFTPSCSLDKPNLQENEANYFANKLLTQIGFWENEELCIYEHELDKSDLAFVHAYKNYLEEHIDQYSYTS